MIYNTIPQTQERISCLTLGTWVFGGDCWGPVEEAECVQAIQTAVDQGINCIDTAPIYGNGQSERMVGKAVKSSREKLLIATKCGLRVEGRKVVNDLSPTSIRREIEQSLDRLQTDYIDIYQCHWPDHKTRLEETMVELEKLKSEGKIRFIGVSNFDLELLTEATALVSIATMQGQYSLLDRKVEENVLPFCRKEPLGFLAYGPLAGGILSGKYAQQPKFPGPDARKFFYKYYEGERFRMVGELLEKLASIGKPLNQIALNWVRQQAGVTSVIVGCRRHQQVLENVEALCWDLSEDQIKSFQMYLAAAKLT